MLQPLVIRPCNIHILQTNAFLDNLRRVKSSFDIYYFIIFHQPMTVRSKQHLGAEIVAIPAGRLAGAKSPSVRDRSSKGNSVSVGADLLSIRQHLTYKASVGIKDLEFLRQAYSVQVGDKLMSSVRVLLDKEFGGLRVHRRHQVFIVNHHCQESLIAGLLRVQFHSRQIPMMATRDGTGLSDVCGIPLSWGAGRTLEEAEEQRLSK